MRTWKNGEKALVIKNIIEQNFNILSQHLDENLLSLTTAEREALTSDYLSNGLLVFDKTLGRWFEYKNNEWKYHADGYKKSFTKSNWSSYKINIPFSEHKVTNPTVQLFILNGDIKEPVLGGFSIDDNFNVTIESDITFNGEVVIK